MKNMRKLTRRSFMARVVGGSVAGGAALVVLGGRAEAFQVTDSDTGPNSDPAGRGRGTGVTDSDPTDRSGAGQGRRACTDSDSGPNSDAPGRGRGSGVTDSDTGAASDRPGCGRGRR